MVCDNLEKWVRVGGKFKREWTCVCLWLTVDESESEKVGLKLNIQHSEN